MSRHNDSAISGVVKPGFEAIREAFAENFSRRNELGAACCIYYQDEKVVDVWGGIRNRATGEPWEENTMVGVFSTAKGMAGLVMALAHSRGLLDYEERVCAYWPEFAQQGKEKITLWSWRNRNRPGSRGRGRPITRKASASTKASCCAG